MLGGVWNRRVWGGRRLVVGRGVEQASVGRVEVSCWEGCGTGECGGRRLVVGRGVEQASVGGRRLVVGRGVEQASVGREEVSCWEGCGTGECGEGGG